MSWRIFDSSGREKVVGTGGGGASAFTDLTDVPASYTGEMGNVVAVNATEDALEFIAPGGSSSDSFTTIAVSGQSSVVADSSTDTLTIAAGSGMTITTNAGTDTVTFASSGGSGYWDATYQISGSNFTTTSASLVDITGLSHAASTSSLYEVEVVLAFQNSATGAIHLAITYSAAGATGSFVYNGAQSTTTSLNEMGVLSTIQAGSYGLVATTDFVALVRGIVKTGANAGNITTQVKIASGTFTGYIGSIMKIKKLA